MMLCAGSAGHKVSETTGTQQKNENGIRGRVNEAIVIDKAPKVPSSHPLTLPTCLVKYYGSNLQNRKTLEAKLLTKSLPLTRGSGVNPGLSISRARCKNYPF